MKTTNMLRVSGINEANWLLTEDYLIEGAMNKSIFNIELMDWPGTRDGETKDYPDGW